MKEIDLPTNAYDVGYDQGISDKEPDCPYEPDTEAYKDFWKGYYDGSWDL